MRTVYAVFSNDVRVLLCQGDLDVSCREGVKTRVVVMSHFVKPKCVPTPFFQFQPFSSSVA